MCGIVGVAASHPEVRLPVAAQAAIAHRGPDGAGEQRWSNQRSSWHIAHSRLAIVDLSDAGAQPMANEDGSLVMVFNGEIYNSPELRRLCEAKGHTFSSAMDGEVILHLWEMEGLAGVARLNGIFAFALADTSTGEVVLARDPLGVKPLFFAQDGETLWFASEVAALVAAEAPAKGADLVALAQFLTFLWVPDPRTPLAGIASLKPGHLLRWSEGSGRTERYCPALVAEPAAHRLRPAAAVDELRERFSVAARRQLQSDVPIGLMASGGVDSSLVWWATDEALHRAYSIRWPVVDGGEGLHEDADSVARLAQTLRTPVEFLAGESAQPNPLPSSADLFADPAYELTRLIAQSARAGDVKVLLSGQGADELLGGYRRHSVAPLLGRLHLGRSGSLVSRSIASLPGGSGTAEYVARLSAALAAPDSFGAYMYLCSYSTAADRARALGCEEREVTDEVVWQQHRDVYDTIPTGLSFFRKVLALDLAVYLPGLGLAYADRAGMEFGVEIRVPWLDLDLVRWTLTLPDDVLLRRGRGKWVGKELFACVLDPTLARRPKRGFAAPAPTGGNGGDRGFRQSGYFARATAILDEYRADCRL